MGIPAPTELLLILAIVVMIFGTKRIPEIMDSVGKGIKTFKKSLEDDDPVTKHEDRQLTQGTPNEAAKPIESTGEKVDSK